jgi:hypothetical protein
MRRSIAARPEKAMQRIVSFERSGPSQLWAGIP